MTSHPDPALSLADQFAAVAQSRAASIAVSHRGDHLTYRHLDRRSAGLAAAIATTTSPDAIVGICLPAGLDAVVSIVAAIRAGRAYVPLDPTYPTERLRYIIEDARLTAIVVGDRTRHLIDAHHRVIDASDDGAAVDAPPGPAIDTPAYVIYTSGSTGRPKGVVVTQANVVALLSAVGGVFTFGSGDIWSQFHSISFDFSVWEIWGCLLHGARLCILDEEARLAPELLLRALEHERVTVFSVVPSVFRDLAAEFRRLPHSLSLRYVIFGGEVVHLPSVSMFRSACADPVTFVNMYGITETTVHVTAHVLTPDDETALAVSPIGVPLPHLQVLLTDETMSPVPPGDVGEMLITGAGVSTGYLHRPDLTAERFVWRDHDGRRQRFYRSGDLARMNGDGRLEYVGRTDDQVKVHGVRVELGEIEACLEAMPDVLAAAATVQTSVAGSSLLSAYFVPAAPPRPGESQALARRLRESMRTVLPRHLVPGRLVAVTALPRTPSGKLDRSRLPAAARHDPDG